MQMTRRLLKKVNIYSCAAEDSGYIGTKNVPSPIGFVYAEILPSAGKYSHTEN